jgi:hypothetical protein
MKRPFYGQLRHPGTNTIAGHSRLFGALTLMKEQGDGFSPPDRATLEAEAAALTSHPAFDAAALAFCRGMTGFHAGRWVLNVGLSDTPRFVVAALVIHLDAAWPGGATTARVARLCQAGGLAGPKAAKGALSVFRAAGLIRDRPDGSDRRARRLAPTPALLGLMCENLTMRLQAQEALTPLPAAAADWAATEGVLAAFLGRNIEAYAGMDFRLYDGFPEVRAFMDRQCGYLILLELVAAQLAVSCGAVPRLSLSALAQRFDVSRAHVRRLLTDGLAHGWLRVCGHGGDVAVEPETFARLRFWIALEFAWTWRLVGSLGT